MIKKQRIIGKTYLINSLILLADEANKIITFFHIELNHIGINLLQHEIERRGVFINKLTYMLKDIVSKCEICIINKLNNFMKPNNKQILSKYPLERV